MDKIIPAPPFEFLPDEAHLIFFWLFWASSLYRNLQTREIICTLLLINTEEMDLYSASDQTSCCRVVSNPHTLSPHNPDQPEQATHRFPVCIPISLTNLLGPLKNCMNFHMGKEKTAIQTFLWRIHRKLSFPVDNKNWEENKHKILLVLSGFS